MFDRDPPRKIRYVIPFLCLMNTICILFFVIQSFQFKNRLDLLVMDARNLIQKADKLPITEFIGNFTQGVQTFKNITDLVEHYLGIN